MEALLNLLWLVIALFSLAFYLYRSSRDGRRSLSGFTRTTALICALILLFPVISVTDDLHPETLALDGLSGKRTAFQLVAPSHQSAFRTAHLLVTPTLVRSSAFMLLSFAGWADELNVPARENPGVRLIAGRSPPLL